jgi:hypothetical protein
VLHLAVDVFHPAVVIFLAFGIKAYVQLPLLLVAQLRTFVFPIVYGSTMEAVGFSLAVCSWGASL